MIMATMGNDDGRVIIATITTAIRIARLHYDWRLPVVRVTKIPLSKSIISVEVVEIAVTVAKVAARHEVTMIISPVVLKASTRIAKLDRELCFGVRWCQHGKTGSQNSNRSHGC